MPKDGQDAKGKAIYWPTLKEEPAKAEAFCRKWTPYLERAGAARVSAMPGEAVDADSQPVPSVWEYLDLREAGGKMVPPFYDHEVKALGEIEGKFTFKDGSPLPIRFVPDPKRAKPKAADPAPKPAAPVKGVPPRIPPRLPPPKPAAPAPPMDEPEEGPEGERDEGEDHADDQEVPIEPHPAEELVSDASDFSSDSSSPSQAPTGKLNRITVSRGTEVPNSAKTEDSGPANGAKERRKLQASLILRAWDLGDNGVRGDAMIMALASEQPGNTLNEYIRAVNFALDSDAEAAMTAAQRETSPARRRAF